MTTKYALNGLLPKSNIKVHPLKNLGVARFLIMKELNRKLRFFVMWYPKYSLISNVSNTMSPKSYLIKGQASIIKTEYYKETRAFLGLQCTYYAYKQLFCCHEATKN